jgi:eukaryotic-like serine/threonine-protein kinase
MATCPKCGTRYASTVRICTHDGTVLNDEPDRNDPHVGKLLDGKYRLDAFLSQGGMGAVYKATHVMLDKRVAVKLIKPELVTSPEVVRRFQREARAASNLNHPNIVAVYDLGQADDGTLYIAMEYIDGPSLKDVIRRTGPMPVARITAILRQVAGALALAHAHNIIHRDLKPHNVMLARGAAGQEIPKLLDFGIAKTFEEGGTQLTQTGFALGTPQYMAPEQAQGQEVTAQSDLYSLGVMLYEMLVGEVPFDAPTTAAILIKQLTEEPQPPSRRKPEAKVSPALEAIAMRCLAKEPAQRFASAEAFVEALAGADRDTRTAADAPTRVFAAPAAPPPAPVPGRDATTAGGPVAAAVPSQAAPGGAAATTMGAPAAASPPIPPPAPAPVPDRMVTAPPVLAVQANDGTRPTVPGAAVPMTATPKPAGSKRTGLWITLGAVAVLLLAVAAIQLGYVPSGGSSGSTTPAPQTQSAPPPASPAAADAAAPNAARPAPDRSAPADAAASTAARAQSAAPPAASSSAPVSSGTQATEPGGRTAAAARAAAALPPNASAFNNAPGRTTPASASRAAQTGSNEAAAPVATPAPPSQATRPENPPVFFRCEGFPGVCNAVRASLLEGLQKNNLPTARDQNRAAVIVTATVDVVQERVSRDFGTVMQTRTYSVDVSGETRDGTPISMPPPRTFSFDAQFGRERLDENARLIAGDVIDKIKAFWNK